jgi:hypothetical protein
MSARFQVPRENHRFLAVPPRDQWPETVRINRQRLVQPAQLTDLRKQLHQELFSLLLAENPTAPAEAISLLRRACDDQIPMILTGHQPELFHPGVWVKNFATQALAQDVGGIGLHLIVDNDTVKSTELRLPVWPGDDLSSVRIVSLPFDRPGMEMPYELRQIQDLDCFLSFPQRVAAMTANWGYEPLLRRLWPTQLPAQDFTLSRCFVHMRRGCEQAWGCVNWELPVSVLAKTAAFAQFVDRIVADLPRFQQVYNASVLAYRRRYRIRSQHHPVPLLDSDEAPFWGPASESGRRGRLQRSSRCPRDAVRPRALTLTLFARLLLGDFFIHGIGGGKYDEVTDAIIRDYYHLDPPGYGVLSATLFLPLPQLPLPEADSRKLKQQYRDLIWNPQRYVDDAEEIKAKKEWLIRHEPQDRRARRGWFQELRATTEQLRARLAEPLATIESTLASAQVLEEAQRRLCRRDFSWILYPEAELKPFLQSFAMPEMAPATRVICQ